MTDQAVVHIAVMTMVVAGKVAGPILLVSLGLGLGISLIQAVTQIQEVTLTFVPKLIGVALVIVISGNWMLREITNFTKEVYSLIPSLVG
jgi:flagellar biosynthesis protein FliQ